MNKRRVGRFLIRYKVFRAIFEERYTQEALLEMFSKIIIVRAEAKFIYDAIEYEGFSELFDEVPEGETIPEYSPIFTHLPENVIKFDGMEKI